MSYTLLPDGNVTQTNFTGGYAEIDDVSDADYAIATSGTATLEVSLENPIGIPQGTITVSFRAGLADSAGSDLFCRVYQGATLIASFEEIGHLDGAVAPYTFTPNMSAVTNWNDIRLRFSATLATNLRITTARITFPSILFSDSLTFSSTPGYSHSPVATFRPTISYISTPGEDLGSTSSGSIHAFARQVYGEIWFVVPIGGTTSHNYYTFCVEESEGQQTPVWFKGGIDAAAVLDDPGLGADTFWSCLRIPDAASATIVSFDKRTGGTITVDWSLTSSTFYIDEGARRVMLLGYHKDFETQDDTVSLTISTRDEPNGNVIANPSYAVAATDTRKDFRVSGKLMTMEFSGSDRWRLGKPAFEIETMGER